MQTTSWLEEMRLLIGPRGGEKGAASLPFSYCFQLVRKTWKQHREFVIHSWSWWPASLVVCDLMFFGSRNPLSSLLSGYILKNVSWLLEAFIFNQFLYWKYWENIALQAEQAWTGRRWSDDLKRNEQKYPKKHFEISFNWLCHFVDHLVVLQKQYLLMPPKSKYRNTRKVRIIDNPAPLHAVTFAVCAAMCFAVHVCTQTCRWVRILFKKSKYVI